MPRVHAASVDRTCIDYALHARHSGGFVHVPRAYDVGTQYNVELVLNADAPEMHNCIHSLHEARNGLEVAQIRLDHIIVRT
jgi:hypothetical protein